MMMLWKVRRRPSTLARIVRSALMIGAAVVVPVGLEVLRRVARRRGLALAHNGRISETRTEASSRGGRSSAARRKRSPTMART